MNEEIIEVIRRYDPSVYGYDKKLVVANFYEIKNMVDAYLNNTTNMNDRAKTKATFRSWVRSQNDEMVTRLIDSYISNGKNNTEETAEFERQMEIIKDIVLETEGDSKRAKQLDKLGLEAISRYSVDSQSPRMVEIVKLSDIDRFYSPYKDLSTYLEDENLEGIVLDYVNNFKSSIEKYKGDLDHEYDGIIDQIFTDVVRRRNDEMVEEILQGYVSSKDKNEENIVALKRRIRVIKDIILATEKSDMKRLQMVDESVGDIIDKNSVDLQVTNALKIEELFERFASLSGLTMDEYDKCVASFRYAIERISNHYRKNYSVKTATWHIRELTDRMNEAIDAKSFELGVYDKEMKYIDSITTDYLMAVDVGRKSNDDYVMQVVTTFKGEIKEFKDKISLRHSKKTAKKLLVLVGKKADLAIERLTSASFCDCALILKCHKIFGEYHPENLDIFDISFYANDADRETAIKKYREARSIEEQRVFEMRMYEEYVRRFKGKIRVLNKEVRALLSERDANKMVNSINRKADRLICDMAKEIGKPVPKNPWLIRKYLWADTNNFLSERGTRVRQFLNPMISEILKTQMNNKIIIEERPELDPTKQYIFVSTHYFTEDVIGLFSALGRQAYMVMGTTDQIENNPLMMAALLLGFLHVDRMDSLNRKECLEKQNRVIDVGSNFINYVGGSWENSENELQPLSFSGPYRSSVYKNVQIVPVGSCLVREEGKMYVRFGEPMEISQYSEEEGNEMIRDALASIHYKQLEKHTHSITDKYVAGYGFTHDLPYDQHTYYMDQVGNEYWNQPWSKPFAYEEIGVRHAKQATELEVYKFTENLSRGSLIENAGVLAEPLVRIDEVENRYNTITYLDQNYDRFKENNGKKKTKKKSDAGKIA